jgi:transcription antitermination factor NusG
MPDIFPHDVRHWVALRTSARWEKQLAAALAALAVPVFPGYVFSSEPEFLGNPRVTPGVRAKVAQVLRPPDAEKLLAELRGLAELLTDRRLVQERLVDAVDDVVRVTGGPLAGHEGRVVRVKPNRWVLVVEVSFLGVRLEAEVDERLVEKVV